MRDGPPAVTASYSTSTLLKEITLLRSRLNELSTLEDDTRSNVSSTYHQPFSDSGFSNAMLLEKESIVNESLRKELAKVEHAKANLELEFMNQLSSLAADNRRALADLQGKLIQAEAKLEAREVEGKNDSETQKWMNIIEEARECHLQEIDQLKQTLASSDMEITDSRRLLDDLEAQLEEVLAEKEEYARDVTEVRLQYSEEQRRVESLRNELKHSNAAIQQLRIELAEKDKALATKEEESGEMNDRVVELEHHKDMLVLEITELKMRAHKQSFAKSESNESSREDGVKQLEEQLTTICAKLSDRDATIEKLSTSMSDERHKSQQLKSHIMQMRANSGKVQSTNDKTVSETSPTNLSRPSHIVTSSDAAATSPRTPVAALVASFEKRSPVDSPLSDVPSTSPKSASELLEQLRAEKQLVKELESKLRSAQDELSHFKSDLPADDPAALQANLRAAKTEICRLQALSTACNDSHNQEIVELEEHLFAERDLVSKLRCGLNQATAKRDQSSSVVVASVIKAKLEAKDVEIESLEAKLKECDEITQHQEQTIIELEGKLYEEKERVHKLHIAADEKEESLQESLQQFEDDLVKEKELVKKLRSDLTHAESNAGASIAGLKAELGESTREIEQLQLRLKKLEGSPSSQKSSSSKEASELAKLRMKAHRASSEKRHLEEKVLRLEMALSYGTDSGEEKKESDGRVGADSNEVDYLRSQISALQAELDCAMTEIERLLGESERLHNERRLALSSRSLGNSNMSENGKQLYDRQITELQIELTKTAVAKKELEAEFEMRVKELEEELEGLEVEADEELAKKESEVSALKQDLEVQKTMIARMEVQQKSMLTSMNDVSSSRQDEMDELQAEIISMTSKTSSQAREIQSLKMKIDELENRKGDAEKKLHARIRDLEQEILDTKNNSRHHSHALEAEDLREENTKLRDALRETKMERRTYKERLDALVAEKSSSKSAQILRDRNASLKEEVEKLTKRLKKMETSITRFAI
jgi:chromosome segregation ATPase